MTASVNVPATPVAPTRIVGRRSRTSSSERRAWPGRPRRAPPARASWHRGRSGPRGRGPASRPARSPRRWPPRTARPRASRAAAAARCRSRRAPAPTSTIRASAERPARRPQPGQDPGQDHRGRALDVVVERRHAALVAVEQAQRVGLLEVLELDHAARPDLLDAADEGLDERVVLGAAQPRRPIAEVERIGEERRVVGPDVERDRQGQGRVDPAGRRVQRELADRDGHAAGALVAEPEDPLVVGHDDEPDVLERPLAQERPGSGRGPPGVIQVPRVRRMMWLNSWHARPTVGV